MTIIPAPLRTLETEAKRVREILYVLAKYGFADVLHRIPFLARHVQESKSEKPNLSSLTRDERIVLAIEELGTTYIKLGQMLSTRPDVVGEALAHELAKLQSRTPSDPPETVHDVFVQEFGTPPAELFAEFDAMAFASASIAQVHLARLKSGERVAVKVQRRGIKKTVEDDLLVMAALAQAVEDHLPESKNYQPVALVREFRRTILNELDFGKERRNLERFGKNFANDQTVRFPRPWGEFCTSQVLTMDFMDGAPCTDIAAMEESGADLREVAHNGAVVYLNMIFRDSFYHADPHPGNLMVLDGGVVGILDCGMVGRLDSTLHDDFETLMLALTQGDSEQLADVLRKLSPQATQVSQSDLQSDLAELLAETSDVAVDEIDMGHVIMGLSALVRKYKISLRPALTQLLRTLVLLQGTAQRLDPKFGLAQVIAPYYEQTLLQRLSPQRLLRRLVRAHRDIDRLLDSLPRDVADTMNQLRTGKVRVQVEHHHLDRAVSRLVLGIVLAALLLSSSLLWSFKAPPCIDGVSVFGSIGYVAAVIIGFRLVRAPED